MINGHSRSVTASRKLLTGTDVLAGPAAGRCPIFQAGTLWGQGHRDPPHGGGHYADPDRCRKNAPYGTPQPPGGVGRYAKVGKLLWIRGKVWHGRVRSPAGPFRTDPVPSTQCCQEQLDAVPAGSNVPVQQLGTATYPSDYLHGPPSTCGLRWTPIS